MGGGGWAPIAGSELVNINGARVCYRLAQPSCGSDSSGAPVVVLMHGIGSYSRRVCCVRTVVLHSVVVVCPLCVLPHAHSHPQLLERHAPGARGGGVSSALVRLGGPRVQRRAGRRAVQRRGARFAGVRAYDCVLCVMGAGVACCLCSCAGVRCALFLCVVSCCDVCVSTALCVAVM